MQKNKTRLAARDLFELSQNGTVQGELFHPATKKKIKKSPHQNQKLSSQYHKSFFTTKVVSRNTPNEVKCDSS